MSYVRRSAISLKPKTQLLTSLFQSFRSLPSDLGQRDHSNSLKFERFLSFFENVSTTYDNRHLPTCLNLLTAEVMSKVFKLRTSLPQIKKRKWSLYR